MTTPTNLNMLTRNTWNINILTINLMKIYPSDSWVAELEEVWVVWKEDKMDLPLG